MNKFSILRFSSCALLLVMACEGNAGPTFSAVDEWTLRQVEPPTNTLPVDDALLALSKASSANIFADVSHVDADKVVEPYADRKKIPYEASPGTLMSVSWDFARQAELSDYRNNTDTLLFWRTPDTQRLLDLIIAYQKQLDADFPRGDEKATVAALQEFLARNYGWQTKTETLAEKKQRTQGIDASISLTDLPPELRGPIEADIYAQVRRFSSAPSYQSFDLAFWKDARVQIFKSPLWSEPIPNLKIFVAHAGDESGNQISEHFNVGIPRWRLRLDKAVPAKPKGQQNQAKPPKQATQTTKVEAAVPAPRSGLEADPDLQKPVVFSIKRQPLPDFIADLQKQSGVSLKLAPDVPKEALLTAHSGGMSLASALQSLSRLYSAHWVKAEQSYTLTSDNLDELHLLMAQKGFGAFYKSDGLTSEEQEELGTQLADEIAGALDEHLLESREGAPFSELPVELQERTIDFFRRSKRGEFITAHQRLAEVRAEIKAQNVKLHLSPLPANTTSYFGKFHTAGADKMRDSFIRGQVPLAAYTTDGQFIVPTLRSFSISKVDNIDEIKERLRLRREQWEATRQQKQP